jgi:hypothetical protein
MVHSLSPYGVATGRRLAVASRMKLVNNFTSYAISCETTFIPVVSLVPK